MKLGSIEQYSQRSFESSAPTKGMFRLTARRHFQQRFFLVLGVAAAQQSTAPPSTAAAAMTARTASNFALASLLNCRRKASVGLPLLWFR
jgi:hypothetical protein